MNNNMLQRCKNWDYRQRAIYMITITVEGRRPLLGILEGEGDKAAVRKSAIGEVVEQCWMDIPKYYPGVRILAVMVMPDHFHGVPFITVTQEKPLGAIIRGFKAGTSKAYREMMEREPGTGMPGKYAGPQDGRGAGQGAAVGVPGKYAGPQDGWSAGQGAAGAGMPGKYAGAQGAFTGSVAPHICGASPVFRLWAPGYHDRILFRRGQLESMLRYVADNPRRLAVRRAHPDLFRVVRNIFLCGHNFSGIGNHFLLQQPVRLPVQCSRHLTEAAITQQEETLLAAARHGALLISPCVSPGEKRIARAALEAALPLVVLPENGFPAFYKPPERYFTACENGHLLMLAPWPYHSEKRVISREQCLALNDFARQLSSDEGDHGKESQSG